MCSERTWASRVIGHCNVEKTMVIRVREVKADMAGGLAQIDLGLGIAKDGLRGVKRALTLALIYVSASA